MWEDLVKPLLAVMAVVLAVLFIIIALTYGATSWSCSNYEVASGRPTEYVFPTGCFIEYEGEKILWEEYKYRFVAKEQVK